MASVSKLTYSYRRAGGIGIGIEGPVKWEKAYLNWQDFTSTGTTNLFIIPANAFVVLLWLSIITSWTSDANATMAFDESSGAGTYITPTAGAKAALTAGSVLKGHIQTLSETGVSILGTAAGHNDEYDSAERTLDLIVGTDGFTAGAAWLDVGMIIQPSVRS